MNGNVSAPDDARAALQALVGTPSSTIRQAFRADIQKALQKRAKPAGCPEGGGQLSEILAKVQALPKKPRTAGALPPGRAGAAPPLSVVSLADPVVEPPRAPSPPAQSSRRSLVIEEDDDFTISLRSEVNDAQHRVAAADKEVTRLTHALRKCRVELWSQQREHTAAERRIVQFIEDHIEEIPEPLRKEEKRLEHEERILVNESIKARMDSTRWLQVAKRQDGMLQQELDSGEHAQDREVARILARHPAGAVFLAQQLPPDNDSDDGFDARNPRSKWTRWVDDDDEDEEVPRDWAPHGGAGDPRHYYADSSSEQVPPPPPPAQPLRDPLGYDDDAASSMSSPSESASGDSSGGATPVGGSKLQGGMHGAGASNARAKDRLGMDRESTSSSDDESSEAINVEVPSPRRATDV